ncbi:sun protein [Candidatus Magnetomorum sp. HK-1]|nr:sun protein [Candidatus Magnetomorum sp. HK-1]
MKLTIPTVQKKLLSEIKNDPRILSLFVLNDFQIKDCQLDTLMEDAYYTAKSFEQRDRALFFSLVYGVIRWKSHLDFVIKQFSRTSFSKIDISICNVLRIGLFQILFMDRIPHHAAVNTSVEVARIFAPPYLIRFVNGVLRHATRSIETIHWPDESKNIAESMAINYSFPKWLIHRWIQEWGKDETQALCISNNIIPPIILRSNTIKINRKDLIVHLHSNVKTISETTHAPDGIFISGLNQQLDQMESFKNGYFQVQDEAAQLISLLVSPKAGEKILDACAGRGGKTGHLAQIMKNQGSIWAVDQSSQKLNTLSSEMKRLEVTNVKTYQHQWKKPIDNHFFDRILLDAPCSGLGVIRRHPDMKWKKTKQHIVQNQKKQARLLEIISTQLKPGGKLVYAVCSLEPEETWNTIEKFLSHHTNFTIEKSVDPILDPFINDKGYFITRPDKHQMDGFFAVCLTMNNE